MEIRTENLNLETVANSLYCLPDGQISPQPTFIDIDPRDDKIIISTNLSGKIGETPPIHVVNGLTKRVTCPPLVLGRALKLYLESEKFQNKVLELCEGYGKIWNGNLDGYWNVNATCIVEDIAGDLDFLDTAEIYDGEDWIEDDLCSNDEGHPLFHDIEIKKENLDELIDRAIYEAAPYQIITDLEEAFLKIIKLIEK